MERGGSTVAAARSSAGQAQRGKGLSEQAFLTSLSTAEQRCLCGLGGSQKGEVAWLDMMGYKYEERDVNERLTGSLHVPNANREGGGLQVTATEWRAKVNSLLQLAHIAERKPGFGGPLRMVDLQVGARRDSFWLLGVVASSRLMSDF